MDITSILYPVLSIGGMGVVFGAFLGFAAIKFRVETDPRVPQVRECLPGANCGGCGYAGCDALADAIVKREAPVNGCPVGGAAAAAKISAVMGVEAGSSEKMVAFVKCNGNCEAAKSKYDYFGITDCEMEANLAGGSKLCSYGCLGDGNCVRACNFGALSIVDGIAVVDEEKCVACGACTKVCPKHLIELVPYASQVRVQCSSNDMPKVSKDNCSNACMGCQLCARNCPEKAVAITKFLAKVDYSKCTTCGTCTEMCPTKAIKYIKKV
ncbi:MAG: RnfABCDGE type electron transport complex subunit B [Clostridiales bacterium]|nr:RnfABCDGE type electron transport complex subunit B [Clostridiales bacterium]